MSIKTLDAIEQEIDEAFASNALAFVPWTQSAWTLLSVVEDHHFKIKIIKPLPVHEATIYVDSLVNSMNYPLRILRERAPRKPTYLDRRYIPMNYELALNWLDSAKDYTQFCSIFPLYHAKEIDLSINGNFLEPTDWSSIDHSFEAYDRFVAKRDPLDEPEPDIHAIGRALHAYICTSDGSYTVNFSRQLMVQLQQHLGQFFEGKHVLPGDWQFTNFSLAQYRSVFICLQITATAWFMARRIVASRVQLYAYGSAVWAPRKGLLLKLIQRHTNLPAKTIQAILKYLTFGEVGIRNPDVAIQPLVDLGNDHYCISPFLMMHLHAERNICVLLNQVSADRTLYAALVNEKESLLRSETISSLQPLGLDFKYGRINETDVDLAIIDHDGKVCLCIELKWFIEPAEIREVMVRSQELQKGVAQAKILTSLYFGKDIRLLTLLGIGDDYEFQAMVGSVNFIGRSNIQDPAVPITKLWHVIAKIKETGSLREVVQWLKHRDYLPTPEKDYKVHEIPIHSGKWKSRWYGIAHQ